MARITIAALVALALSGCTGPFFYHDVIVPTYGQVDTGSGPAVQPQPSLPPAR